MKVLIIGAGGREHALAWKLAQSPNVTQLLVAPGNAGMAKLAQCHAVAGDDLDGLLALAQAEAVDFVVIGPEQALVDGLVDRLNAAGIASFGPTASAAQLEGSKAFTKDFCGRHNIPTAAYASFTDGDAARDYVRRHGAPLVIKADGLAAGKGVIMAATDAEALAAIDNIMDAGAFGAAGTAVVIEEWMHGEEASYFALSDGQNFVTLASAQDHKRVGDGDSGPNTGGMGAYSPAPVVDKDIEQHITDRIIAPTVAGMAAEGRPFKGVLYAGLMITADGPKLIEYNCRFGDPECQVLMARLSSDLLPSLLACHHGNLDQQQLHWRSDAALLVVLAANGYPGSYRKLTEMTVPDDVEDAQTLIFHAGTLRRADGQLLANGGRVLGVTGLGPSIAEAQQKAYQAVDKITWPDGFCRRDIGWQAIDRSG